MTRAGLSVAFVSLAGALIWLLGINLGALPGLHGDEAYFALRALGMARGEGFDAHGMSGHVGSLHPYLVSLLFTRSPSVASLRAISVAANLLALLVGAFLAERAGGGRAAACCLLLLAAGSTLFTFESRLGWEVTAFNPLLASGAIAAALLVLGARPLLGSVALLLVSLVGVFNHFVFLHLCVGLAVCSLWLLTQRRSEAVARLVLASALNVFVVALFAVAKLLCHAKGASFVPVVALAGVLVGAEALVLRRHSALAWAFVLRVGERYERFLRSALRVFFGLGGALFVVFQLPAFTQVFAGSILVERFYSQVLPLPLRVLGVGYAAAVFLLYARAVRATLRTPPDLRLALLVLLPVTTFCSLSLLLGPVTTIRYFVLGNFVLLLALASLLGRAPRRALLASGAFVHACALAVAIVPLLRDPSLLERATPLQFRVGHQQETSRHFLQVAMVVERLRADRVEHVLTTEDFFIGLPIAFHRAVAPWDALPGSSAVVEYDERVPGGFAYELQGRH